MLKHNDTKYCRPESCCTRDHGKLLIVIADFPRVFLKSSTIWEKHSTALTFLKEVLMSELPM